MYVEHNHIKNKYSSSLHGVKCLGPALSQSQTVVVNFRLNCSNACVLYFTDTLRHFFMASLSEIGIKGHHYCLPVAHVVIGRCEQSSK